MGLSQKCQYALKGLFELARRGGPGPVKIGRVAEAQSIPPRFLEVIFGQLKRAGFVRSRRGVEGGYLLARRAAEISVGEIIRFVDGPLSPVAAEHTGPESRIPVEEYAFTMLWRRAEEALSEVYEKTSLQDLVDEDRRAHSRFVPMYTI